MKKIMFNDKFSLTQAVIDGRKVQTRRIVPQSVIDVYDEWRSDVEYIAKPAGSTIEPLCSYLLRKSRFYVSEIVAVAQSYSSIVNELEDCNNANCTGHYEKNVEKVAEYISWMEHPGFNNKMFVCTDLMPHQIQITDVRVERLQDISDEDCLKEGITDMGAGGSLRYSFTENVKQTTGDTIAFSNNFAAAKEAFAHLIDKVSGKGTWNSNPYVFVYDFRLIK